MLASTLAGGSSSRWISSGVIVLFSASVVDSVLVLVLVLGLLILGSSVVPELAVSLSAGFVLWYSLMSRVVSTYSVSLARFARVVALGTSAVMSLSGSAVAKISTAINNTLTMALI